MSTKLMVGHFSAGDLNGWQTKSFAGETHYTLVKQQGGEQQGRQVLCGYSHATASGLFRKITVDLKKTPYLNWSWRLQQVLIGNDERSKAGDDFPLRVYVILTDGLLLWRTRAIVYVWSNQQAIDSIWHNPYSAQSRHLALRSGLQQAGQWLHEKRDVGADFKRLYDVEIAEINAVAVMTDSDNTGQIATGWYGDIYFSAE